MKRANKVVRILNAVLILLIIIRDSYIFFMYDKIPTNLDVMWFMLLISTCIIGSIYAVGEDIIEYFESKYGNNGRV